MGLFIYLPQQSVNADFLSLQLRLSLEPSRLSNILSKDVEASQTLSDRERSSRNFRINQVTIFAAQILQQKTRPCRDDAARCELRRSQFGDRLRLRNAPERIRYVLLRIS